ncbi:hypothetical protein AVEN_82822-1 [Araneus ventricosus]|uniref:Tetraspanin n=1 Tax=Araneus ventricosus TaxID=182803 RepID=A0A4Y2F909_ARAVE|nr:hypothetical protein AVEN_82822-1 [Araneus ventricosus]
MRCMYLNWMKPVLTNRSHDTLQFFYGKWPNSSTFGKYFIITAQLFAVKLYWTIFGERHSGVDRSERVKRAWRISEAVKNGLYIVNWLFLVSSAMTLVIGLYLYWKFEVIQILMDVDFNPDLYIIGLSIFLFVIGCVGYVAIPHQNIRLFYWYLLSLVVLMMLYVPIGSAAFAFSVDGYKSGQEAKEVWIALHNYFELPISRKLMDEIQKMLQCCGITDYGYRDWNHNFHFECDVNNFSPERCAVPSSCCKLHRGRDTDPMCGAYVLNNTIMSQISTRSCMFHYSRASQRKKVTRSITPKQIILGIFFLLKRATDGCSCWQCSLNFRLVIANGVFLWAEDVSAYEIHRQIVEVYGELSMSKYREIALLLFESGREIAESRYNSLTVLLSLSTPKINTARVDGVILNDPRLSLHAVASEMTLYNILLGKYRPGMLLDGIIPLHDNAGPHTSHQVVHCN